MREVWKEMESGCGLLDRNDDAARMFGHRPT